MTKLQRWDAKAIWSLLLHDHASQIEWHKADEADAVIEQLQARIDELELITGYKFHEEPVQRLKNKIVADGIEEMLLDCKQWEYDPVTGNYDKTTGKIDVEDAEDYIAKLRSNDEAT